MQWWTIFYHGWWIAWSSFVGTFIARISKGRTIREVFNYSITAPLLYVILWFTVFGGAGIKMHNTAIECKLQTELGFYKDSYAGFVTEYANSICCPVSTKFRASGGYEILTIDGLANATVDQVATANMCEYLRPQSWNVTVCGDAEKADNSDRTACKTLGEYREMVFDEDFTELERVYREPAIGSGASGTAKAERATGRRTVYTFEYDGSANFLEVIEQYHGWGNVLSGITIVAIVLYSVTSISSGMCVVDLVAAGGNQDKDGNDKDPHWVQQALWSLTEGALAIGLMTAGGADATKSLQATLIILGLPFTIVLCFMMPSLLRMLAFEDSKVKITDHQWNFPIYGGFLDIFDVVFSFGGLLSGCPSITDLIESGVEVLVGLLPFLHAYKVLAKLDVDGKAQFSNFVKVFAILALQFVWVVCWIMAIAAGAGWFAFANAFYIAMVIVLMNIRGQVRESQGIPGTIIEDFLLCFFFFFNTGPQNWDQVQNPKTIVVHDDTMFEANASNSFGF
jgi:hypothetical protein